MSERRSLLQKKRRVRRICEPFADNKDELSVLCNMEFLNHEQRYKYLIDLELKKAVNFNLIENTERLKTMINSDDAEIKDMVQRIVKDLRKRRLK